MIVGTQKPMEEIWEMIKGYKKVLVFGCNTCVAVCHQGGNKEAEIMASMLNMHAAQEGVEIEIQHSGIERQCEHEFFDPAEDIIAGVDAVLSTACGIGVQFMAEKYVNTPLFPGLDTCFLGAVDEHGVFSEKCQACGKCVLGQTGGICPVTRCSKGLFNGPCGGTNNECCEVSQEIPCAWLDIFNRLKAQGRLDDIKKIHAPMEWQNQTPRTIVQESYEQRYRV